MPQSNSGGRGGSGTRPTTDRVRESVFNVLDARMELAGVTVLDLYAGSGALGIEALSRGAASATFVESDRRAAAVITQNLAALGITGATVRSTTVAAVLAGGTDRPADLVFADPPYEVPAADVEVVLAALVDRGWVAHGAVAVVERAASGPALAWPAGWTPGLDRRYGDTRLEFGCFGDSRDWPEAAR
ncbi:MAG: rRNA (guanine966-N2)-methyltransferase [Mycobacterium sp.]|nr:rRNA (guanine966-N2)-methyltransferase [Mycobacterium sp.]